MTAFVTCREKKHFCSEAQTRLEGFHFRVRLFFLTRFSVPLSPLAVPMGNLSSGEGRGGHKEESFPLLFICIQMGVPLALLRIPSLKAAQDIAHRKKTAVAPNGLLWRIGFGQVQKILPREDLQFCYGHTIELDVARKIFVM